MFHRGLYFLFLFFPVFSFLKHPEFSSNTFKKKVAADSSETQRTKSHANIFLNKNTIYVNKNVSGGDGSGSSWENAIAELADALRWAKENRSQWPQYSSLKIFVAAGVYKPLYSPRDGADFADEGRDNAFLVAPDVEVYGGFSGSETAPEERDLKNQSNKTILSGDLDNTGTLSDGDAYHVVVSVGFVGSALFNGVTITGGNANGGTNRIRVNNININKQDGGGWYNHAGNIKIDNVTISGNLAGRGGGWYNNLGNPSVKNTIITGNRAEAATHGGGGWINMGGNPTMTNVLISGNKSKLGGGWYNNGGNPVLTNLTISGNWASDNGGGMYRAGGSPKIYNSILWGNAGELWGNDITVAHSFIQGGFSGTENSSEDPLFIEPVSYTQAPYIGGDYRLQVASPCINTGNNNYLSANITTDLAGNDRILESAVDIGAFEIASCRLNVLYVDKAAATSGNGSSWATPLNSFALALKIAHQCPNIDTIKVAAGTYYPEYTPPTSETRLSEGDKTFYVFRDGLVLLGGYPTGGGVRDWNENKVILSGDIDGDGIINFGNSYHVMLIVGESAEKPINNTLVIDGFTFTQGHASGSSLGILYNGASVNRYNGGGVCMYYSSPIINNSLFLDNNGFYGGGMYNSGSSPTINNTRFSGNVSGYLGGGMYNIRSSPIIKNGVFSGNQAKTSGSGIHSTNGTLAIFNSSFSGNNSTEEPGGVIYNQTNLTLSNSIIYGNSSGIVNFPYSNQPVINYSLVQDLSSTANGNIHGGIDPLFEVAPNYTSAPFVNGDYRLQNCSPAINTGAIDIIGLNLPANDVLGNNRIQLGRIDMGAYEKPFDAQMAEVATDNTANNQLQSSSSTTHYADNCFQLIASITGDGTTTSVSDSVSVQLTTSQILLPQFVNRKYEIIPSVNANTATASVTLYYTQTEFTDYNNEAANITKLPYSSTDEDNKKNVKIRKANEAGEVDIAPTTVLWNENTQRWEVTFFVTGFSDFYLFAIEDNALPLTLLRFTAKEENCNAILNWTTADEQNVSHFEIEQSADGVNWRFLPSVGMTTAKGRSENDYSATLPIPPSGVRGLYYRLKMVDIDGQFSYSPIVTLNPNCNLQKVSVYPNPVKNKIYIQGLSIGDRYRLINSSGQLILSGNAIGVTEEVNTSSLTAGLYILHIVGKEGKEQQIKLIKE